jgi:hypothetical protein
MLPCHGLDAAMPRGESAFIDKSPLGSTIKAVVPPTDTAHHAESLFLGVKQFHYPIYVINMQSPDGHQKD